MRELSEELKSLYPFSSNFIRIHGHNMHYVDEGEGELCFLAVHGNPTWSFYYRELIKSFSPWARVVVPDHIGCGLSERPASYEHTLENRISDLEGLVDALKLKNIVLVVHDWGGAIGLGLATRRPELISQIIVLNTAAFASERIPFRIALCKNRVFGDFLVRNLNGFAWPATFMASKKKLPALVKKGYLFPYGSADERVAVSEFVKDIPMDSKHRSYKTLKAVERNLKDIKCPKLILWGGKDFCFNNSFFEKWKSVYPESFHKYYPDAGHYVLEDERDDVLESIRQFVEEQR